MEKNKPPYPGFPGADTSTIEHWLATARLAALDAGKAILNIYSSDDFEVEIKADASPLTKADKAAHIIISQHLTTTGLPVLSEEGPSVPFVEREAWQWYWLVDPLDGTKEFLKRNGEFTVNIALMFKQAPVGGVVYGPCRDALYVGSAQTGVHKEIEGKQAVIPPLAKRISWEHLQQKSVVTVAASRSHQSPETENLLNQLREVKLETMGSSFKFMLLADNKADLYPRLSPTMEWDTAAGHAILNALNRGLFGLDLRGELKYNKPNLVNPPFLAF
jgi:3'(2'), 5'-bisphosphate nucleotidase